MQGPIPDEEPQKHMDREGVVAEAARFIITPSNAAEVATEVARQTRDLSPRKHSAHIQLINALFAIYRCDGSVEG